jgi:hypothetical protein
VFDSRVPIQFFWSSYVRVANSMVGSWPTVSFKLRKATFRNGWAERSHSCRGHACHSRLSQILCDMSWGSVISALPLLSTTSAVTTASISWLVFPVRGVSEALGGADWGWLGSRGIACCIRIWQILRAVSSATSATRFSPYDPNAMPSSKPPNAHFIHSNTVDILQCLEHTNSNSNFSQKKVFFRFMLNTLFPWIHSDEILAWRFFFLECSHEISPSRRHKSSPRQEVLRSAQTFCGDLNFHTPSDVCIHNNIQIDHHRRYWLASLLI